MNKITLSLNKKLKDCIIYINNSNNYTRASKNKNEFIIYLNPLLENWIISGDLYNYFCRQLNNSMVTNGYRSSRDSASYGYHISKRYKGDYNEQTKSLWSSI